LENDSVVLGNGDCYPYFVGGDPLVSIESIFRNETNLLRLFAVIYISKYGIELDFNVPQNWTLNTGEKEKFTAGMNKTAGLWVLPPGDIGIYKMYLFYTRIPVSTSSISPHGGGPVKGTGVICSIVFGNSDLLNFPGESKKVNSTFAFDNIYNKGLRLLKTNKYSQAIELFDQCIAHDSLYLDAYYNKAFALYQMADVKSACDIWKLLESWGQKTGEAMVKEYCKE
jgi:hypothetical protein